MQHYDPQPIGGYGWCLVGGIIPDPDNPAMLIDCPSDGAACDTCQHYTKDNPELTPDQYII